MGCSCKRVKYRVGGVYQRGKNRPKGERQKGESMKFNDRWTAAERKELDELEAEIESETDKEELKELAIDLRDLFSRAERGAAMRELRKQYNLPSDSEEVDRLVGEIYDLERKIAMAKMPGGGRPFAPAAY